MRLPLRRLTVLALVLATSCVASEPRGGAPPDDPSPRRARSRTATPVRTEDPAPFRIGVRATVTRTIDGDTIEVRVGGRIEPVRLIGIDTPERGTPGFHEATVFTRDAAPAGSNVWLETGVEERDRYGRVLAYVWLRAPASRREAAVRASMLNARVLLRGMAVLLTIPPNVEYVELFTAFQREARLGDRGLWGRAPVRPATSGCDPSYPDVCIPAPPPDLDCAEVRARNFRVIGDDPHGFDYDDDGRGCES